MDLLQPRAPGAPPLLSVKPRPSLTGLWLAALLLASALPATADTFYVGTGGTNGGPGSTNQPWATLQHAANQVEAGDTIVVRPGNYAGFDLRTRGTENAPITFLAEPGAVIDRVNPVTNDGINIEQASHVIIDGFILLSPHADTRAGIRIVGDGDIEPNNFSRHVTVRNNTIHDWGKWGVLTGFVDDVVIERNITTGAVDEHGVYVSNSGDRPIVRYNHIYNNHANGIHLNGDIHTGDTDYPNVDGVITGARVEGNIIHGNGAGGGWGINGDGVVDAVIVNNLLYDNHASGISLYRIDGGAPSTNGLIANNTIVNASNARWVINLRNGATGATIFNNILFNLHSSRGSISAEEGSSVGLISDFNLLEPQFILDGAFRNSLTAWQSDTGQDLNSRSLTLGQMHDLFTDFAANDFTLVSGSAAQDFGAAGLINGYFRPAPTADLIERLRPHGLGYDAGAFEIIPEPSIPTFVAVALFFTCFTRRKPSSWA